MRNSTLLYAVLTDDRYRTAFDGLATWPHSAADYRHRSHRQ
jgi:hypothetical protein